MIDTDDRKLDNAHMQSGIPRFDPVIVMKQNSA